MKKRGKKEKKEKKKHIHLIALVTSKFAVALLAFVIGLYAGSLFENTFVVLIVTLIVASLIYLFSVLHIIDLLKI